MTIHDHDFVAAMSVEGLLDVLFDDDQHPEGFDEAVVSAIVVRTLAGLGVTDVGSWSFDVDDGPFGVIGVGVREVRDTGERVVLLHDEAADALNLAIVGPFVEMCRRRRSRI